jgi:hypothetical protein
MQHLQKSWVAEIRHLGTEKRRRADEAALAVGLDHTNCPVTPVWYFDGKHIPRRYRPPVTFGTSHVQGSLVIK